MTYPSCSAHLTSIPDAAHTGESADGSLSRPLRGHQYRSDAHPRAGVGRTPQTTPHPPTYREPVAALRLVVGEDNGLVREGIIRILERGGIDVVDAVDNADDLRTSAHNLKPDVVMTDIEMPPNHNDDGLRAALELRTTQPEIGIILLSQFLDADYALELVGTHPKGVGYLLKEKVADTATLLDAVRRVAAGESALDPDVIAQLVKRHSGPGPLAHLTPREHDVLTLMAEGHTNAGIAERLVVTVPAVERHVTGIFTKLGLRTADRTQHCRVLAVLTYFRNQRTPYTPS
jgi:DNA-binding NarL/FixJ family response regulator